MRSHLEVSTAPPVLLTRLPSARDNSCLMMSSSSVTPTATRSPLQPPLEDRREGGGGGGGVIFQIRPAGEAAVLLRGADGPPDLQSVDSWLLLSGL